MSTLMNLQNDVPQKRCYHCKQVKEAAAFHKNRSTIDGLAPWCKECRKAYQITHPEHKREYDQAYRNMHRDRRRANSKAWRATHEEERRTYDKRYYAAHRSEKQAYRDLHKKRIQAYHRMYRLINHDKCVAAYRNHYASHKASYNIRWHRYRARLVAATIGHIDYAAIRLRDKMICCICGERVGKDNLSYDHTIPLSLGGSHTETNLRVAHRHCNTKRGAGRLPVQMVLL